ncbi:MULTISPECIES: hypothetical protein [Pseudomonadaceae]|nr:MULTISPECIES: hypothetical protein [Pseudomonas]
MPSLERMYWLPDSGLASLTGGMIVTDALAASQGCDVCRKP